MLLKCMCPESMDFVDDSIYEKDVEMEEMRVFSSSSSQDYSSDNGVTGWKNIHHQIA